jgi:hypothetical protein
VSALDAASPDLGAPVETLRAQVSSGLIRSLVVGALILSVGPIVVVAGMLVGRSVPGVQTPAWALAGLFTIGGPIYALAGVSRSLKDDALLSIRARGVVYERGSAALTIAWDDVARVRFEAPDALVFELKDGERLIVRERFDDLRTLAARLDDLRRKASFGLVG